MSKVKVHIEKSLPAEVKFCKRFGLTRNLLQSKGTAFDAEDAQGFKWEFKDDRMAAKTGNIFLELYQSAGADENGIIWDQSGFQLSLLQARYLVYLIGQEYFKLKCDDLDIWLNENHKKCKEIQTRPGANGNRPGKFAKGLLIKVEDLRTIAEVFHVEK